MQSPQLTRFTTGLSLLSAVFGVVLAIAGLIATQQVRQPLVASTNSLLTSLNAVLGDVIATLTVAEDLTASAEETLLAVENALALVNIALIGAGALADDTGLLLNTELPATIASARTSLQSASATARVVDDTLSLLTSIPLLPVRRYQPAVPLSTSLTALADELEPLPNSLIEIGDGLQTTGSDLTTLAADLAVLRTELGLIRTSLADVQTVNIQTRADLTDLQTTLSDLQTDLPGLLNTLQWGLTVLFIWLLLSQLAALLTSLQMWPNPPTAESPPVPAALPNSPMATETDAPAPTTDNPTAANETAAPEDPN